MLARTSHDPELHRLVDGPALVWRAGTESWQVLSSAISGGGIGRRNWIVNASVAAGYDHPNPPAHIAEIAGGLGLHGPGVGLLTAKNVAEYTTGRDGGVEVIATVGLGQPEWAAAAAPDANPEADPAAGASWVPGTVNIVVFVPVRMSDAAMVNAVVTVTEAKVQALWTLGYEATGTATDAVCIVCLPGGPVEPFGGPRSVWGARIARAVYEAVGGRPL